MTVLEAMERICARYGVVAEPPDPASKLGLSRLARTEVPIYGARHRVEGGTCGWYIWAGEWSDDVDFFEPTHVLHLAETCPLALGFLGLPPGWRFLSDGEYHDVWFDPSLLEVE